MIRLRWLFLLLWGLVALSADAEAALTMTKSSSVSWDPYNLAAFPKAIPGARVDYTITVSNASSTARNVIVSDVIPAKVKFYVGTGNPVTVTIGIFSSLTYTYTSLTNGSDGLDFSNDNGATWTYNPVAGSDGSDPNITNIRVKTGGSQTSGDSWTIKFTAVVK